MRVGTRQVTATARWGTAAVLCTFLVQHADGQEPGRAPSFQGRTTLVQLDVTVTSRGREPIRQLTAADFTVLENGRPRPIDAFLEVDVAPSVKVGDTIVSRVVVFEMA